VQGVANEGHLQLLLDLLRGTHRRQSLSSRTISLQQLLSRC
jgi:hypothetical protein